VAFGVIHGIIPVIIFTMSAVRTIAPVHLKTARVLNLTPFQTAWTILLPAVVPEVFTGLRIGFSLCMLGVIVGEMFASQRGLGFAIMNAMNTYNIRDMTALILLLVIFALLSNTILLIIDRRLHR
jgi:NitT/TauT family transport system permease protein